MPVQFFLSLNLDDNSSIPGPQVTVTQVACDHQGRFRVNLRYLDYVQVYAVFPTVVSLSDTPEDALNVSVSSLGTESVAGVLYFPVSGKTAPAGTLVNVAVLGSTDPYAQPIDADTGVN